MPWLNLRKKIVIDALAEFTEKNSHNPCQRAVGFF